MKKYFLIGLIGVLFAVCGCGEKNKSLSLREEINVFLNNPTTKNYQCLNTAYKKNLEKPFIYETTIDGITKKCTVNNYIDAIECMTNRYIPDDSAGQREYLEICKTYIMAKILLQYSKSTRISKCGGTLDKQILNKFPSILSAKYRLAAQTIDARVTVDLTKKWKEVERIVSVEPIKTEYDDHENLRILLDDSFVFFHKIACGDFDSDNTEGEFYNIYYGLTDSPRIHTECFVIINKNGNVLAIYDPCDVRDYNINKLRALFADDLERTKTAPRH